MPLKVSVLVSLRYLQTSMEAVLGQENMEIETEGYLLEKGVKETIKEMMDKVLKFFHFNQVDASVGQETEVEKPATAAD